MDDVRRLLKSADRHLHRRKTPDEIWEEKRRLRNFFRPEKGEADYQPRIPKVLPEDIEERVVPYSRQTDAVNDARKGIEERGFAQYTLARGDDGECNHDIDASAHRETGNSLPDLEDRLDSGSAEIKRNELSNNERDVLTERIRNVGSKSMGQYCGGLHQAVAYFKRPIVDDATGDVKELVGGEDIAVLATLCYVNNLCFGIEGDSGSGKTLLMDRFLTIPNEEDVYVISQATNRSIHHNSEEINKKKWLVFSEIQKIAAGSGGKPIVELVKDLAEGKQAKFEYYVSRNKTGSIVIDPKNVAFTRALENAWDLDSELRRRFIIATTDSSIEHTQAVNYKTLENWMRLDYGTDDMRGHEEFRKHVQRVSGLENIRFVDPFAFSFGELIEDVPKSTSFIPQYGSLVRASARYHINDRVKFNHNGQNYVLVSVEDHHVVHESYFRHFQKTLESWNQEELNMPGEVDWSDYFCKGAREMQSNEQLGKLRERKNLVRKWICSQIDEGMIISEDYATGKRMSIGEYR